jgi:acetylornithine deacetylase/succinyl-diaminopimelate desuccinylase-like protein
MMTISPEKLLSDLIKINTVNPPGNETAAAEYLKNLFKEAGLESEIVEPEAGRGTFIARIGKGPKKLLFVSHLDVVPVGDDWDFEPFSGEVKDGVIYGRGALDCKDLTAAQVVAALELQAEGVPLNGQIIIVATADEEKGGTLGADYLIKKEADKIKADYAVNEGADQPILINDKLAYFIQVGEKGTAWCTLKAHGVAGHGSIPTLADNAVVKMARAVCRLHNYRAEVVVVPEVEKLLKSLAKLCNLELKTCSADDVDALLEQLPLERAFVEALRSMTRMTVSPNQIRGGTKTNIVPDYCEADIDIRILPGQDCDYVEKELRMIISKDIEIEFTECKAPTFSSADDSFYQLMEEITLDLTGKGTICLPVISSGSTDSKYLRGAGIPSYGIGLMAPGFDQEARSTIHGRNERIDIASLHLKTAFLKELARRYLG